MAEPDTQSRNPSTHFDLVVLAASAGGVSALSEVLEGLPADFPAAIAIVQHLDPRHRSLMAEILGRRSLLRVKQAEEGDRLAPGTVFMAPPDRHLLINPEGTLSLSDSDKIHFLRPSADLLFESAAASNLKRVIAVVLTGTGRDGSIGVTAVKKTGGTVIVQEAETAEFSGMPDAARRTGDCDFVLPLSEIPGALVRLVMHADANDRGQEQ